MNHHGTVKNSPNSPENRVKIMDLTLRDGHQSLFATRGRTEDMIPVAELMDAAGFWAMEIWGGATFDTMHRFLNEDPWERLRTLKKHITKTPVSMLLRGQNLVGYRNYADDVVELFIDRAAENGIDIFRTFDALNDFRNFDTVHRKIKEHKKHFQGCICYSLTEKNMGGEVYNLKYYLDKVKQLDALEADSICIKDMAGLMSPYDAFELISAVKKITDTPILLHSHFTSGLASMTQLKAIEAGVDIVDTCMSPYAYRTSHTAVEPLVMTLMGTNRDTGLDINYFSKINTILEKEILPKYKHFLDDTKFSIIDTNVLLHQVPGGMLSNLVNQLTEMGAIDRLDDVFKELPRVRKDLGQIPLVTPTSQIVGSQTVNNVLFDKKERYTMITDQVKDLCAGYYGRTPVPIDTELQKKALAEHHRSKPIEEKPSSTLEPELPKAFDDLKDITENREDVLLYALFPVTGKLFLNWKYGITEAPEETLPVSFEEARKVHEQIGDLKKSLMVKEEKAPRLPGGNYRSFNVIVNDEHFKVDVEDSGSIKSVEPQHPFSSAFVKNAGGEKSSDLPKAVTSSPRSPNRNDERYVQVTAPMNGMIVNILKEAGSPVNEGETVAVLEAMKMENALTAPISGIVSEIFIGIGETAAANAVVFEIKKNPS